MTVIISYSITYFGEVKKVGTLTIEDVDDIEKVKEYALQIVAEEEQMGWDEDVEQSYNIKSLSIEVTEKK